MPSSFTSNKLRKGWRFRVKNLSWHCSLYLQTTKSCQNKKKTNLPNVPNLHIPDNVRHPCFLIIFTLQLMLLVHLTTSNHQTRIQSLTSSPSSSQNKYSMQIIHKRQTSAVYVHNTFMICTIYANAKCKRKKIRLISFANISICARNYVPNKKIYSEVLNKNKIEKS